MVADLLKRWKNHMATCDLNAVDHSGGRALCRFMYTEYGFAIPTLHDGGNRVHYRDVPTAQWERRRQRRTGRSGGHSGELGVWPSNVKPAE